jgi:hypothetical protein
VGTNYSNFKISEPIYLKECFVSTADLLRPKKRAKIDKISSVTIGYLESRKGSLKSRDLKG